MKSRFDSNVVNNSSGLLADFSTGTKPIATQGVKAKYVLMSPWIVKAGTGVNNVILGLRDALRQYYEPEIVSTGWSKPPEGQLWCKLHVPTLPLKNFFAFVLFFIPTLVKLRRLTRGAAAVNPHFIGLTYLPVCVLKRLGFCSRLIFSVHGADVANILKSSGIQRAVFRWMFEQADLVVACSHDLASQAKQISSKPNVVAVWNASPLPGNVRLQRPLNERYIVSVAAFHFHKGHDILLRAFESISDAFPDMHLVLIGSDAPERSSIEAEIKSRGLEQKVHTKISLEHDEVWAWVKNASCFVLASRREPFGICLLEAALMRTPVVATEVGGIPEIVPDQVHGLLCPPENPKRLAELIVETLSQTEAASERARRFCNFASGLTWDEAANAYRNHAKLP